MPKSKLTYTTLTATHCDNARPREKVWYLPDRGRGSVRGLRLGIMPSGSKQWLQRYYLPVVDSNGAAVMETNGKPRMKESTAGLGLYPEVSLQAARDLARIVEEAAAAGRHPTFVRTANRVANAVDEAHTLRFVAERWLQQGEKQGFARTTGAETRPWSAHHLERNTGLVTRFLLPELGSIPIRDLTAPRVEAVILKAYDSGKRESARRAAVIARQIMGYAKARRWVNANPLMDILAHPDIPKPEVKHFAAIKQGEVGPMLRALAASRTEVVTRGALLLMLFTGLRDYSLRGATWSEIDLEGATWTVPAGRMKSRKSHAVPLPRQAVEVFKALAKLTNKGPTSFVFASRNKAGFLAENTLRNRLHGLGFKVTAHGFRSLLTDVLNQNRFNPDAVERQLDHVQQNQVRASYLRTDFMEQRRVMMQWFADWAEAQCNRTEVPSLPDGNVVPLRHVA